MNILGSCPSCNGFVKKITEIRPQTFQQRSALSTTASHCEHASGVQTCSNMTCSKQTKPKKNTEQSKLHSRVLGPVHWWSERPANCGLLPSSISAWHSQHSEQFQCPDTPMGGHSFPIPTASHNVIAPLLVVGAFSKLIFFSEAPTKAHDRKGIPALLSLLQLVFACSLGAVCACSIHLSAPSEHLVAPKS